MKKLFLLPAFFFLLSALAYTSEDVSNANSLADQQIVTKQTVASKYRLDDKILRQEVIGMALKVKGIALPDNYSCKKYFADTIKNDWVCRAVELAADNGIITRSNKYANPGKYVTRAEALAMMMKAAGITIQTDKNMGDSIDGIGWQKDVVSTVLSLGLWKNNTYKTTYNSGEYAFSTSKKIIFSPNQSILRREVFQFLYNSLELKEAKKTAININFKDLDTQSQTDLGMNEIQKPCMQKNSDNGMSNEEYFAQEFICGTREYEQTNSVFKKSVREFISGKYIENLSEVCKLWLPPINCTNLRIEKDNIFITSVGMGGAWIQQLVIHNGQLFSRTIGWYNEGDTSFSGTEDMEAFYQQILNGGVIQY